MAEKKYNIITEIAIPEGTQITFENDMLKVKGSKGDVERNLKNPLVKLEVKEGKVILSSIKFTKREKKLSGTFKAHVNNMIRGSNEQHIYKLKICSSHFPMNVSMGNGELVVKNFFGEKSPRHLKLKSDCEVKIDGTDIIVKSCNIEIAGQVAADIESLTRLTNKDRRVFQDGIFITEKDGKGLI
ncbi:MAG: 50S ribosomal protein L6 [Nanoarchaeota archaeon]|nr:50S ribosomal protein L6 [Nanoarchaeota archaeon]